MVLADSSAEGGVKRCGRCVEWLEVRRGMGDLKRCGSFAGDSRVSRVSVRQNTSVHMNTHQVAGHIDAFVP